MYLVPNVESPKKFKMPKLTKYTGIECPRTYMKIYYSKMVKAIKNEKLFILYFHKSLNGDALTRYMDLDRTKIKK